MLREEPSHLPNRCLIDAPGIHNVIEDTDIERHDRNCCGRLCNDGFVHRYIGITTELICESLVKCVNTRLEIVLRPTDGPVPINGPR